MLIESEVEKNQNGQKVEYGRFSITTKRLEPRNNFSLVFFFRRGLQI